ncbi:MAG: repair protein SbcC/Rad50, partial [Thermoplasmata archaeon]|nr:repair protein SbcC/Rad50 [Thermoplasmata archaeon]
MRITKLFLRNYRVYEDALELEIPAGLVGIVGANGAGKSYLLESILFAIYGYSRTAKDDVRTTGVNGECVVEVQFEHEGHLYDVRRTISGVNSTVKALAMVNGQQVAEGVTDTTRYMHSVLGMDATAFRSSVFAEQKQVAAFSGKTPAERQKLVLRLLGITPLDVARDAARKDARETQLQLDKLRTMLPDLEALRASLDGARAEAALREAEASVAEQAAVAASAEAEQAGARFEQLDAVHREHEDLVKQGQAVRKEQDDAAKRVDKLERELAGLTDAQAQADALAPDADGLAEAERLLRLVEAATTATAKVDGLVVGPEPDPPDEAGAEAARTAAEEATAALAGVEAQLQAAIAELERARAAMAKSADLSSDEDCPVCGQELGDAFAQVQAHRAEELAEREQRVAELQAARTSAVADVGTLRDRATNLDRDIKAARSAHAAWQQAKARRTDAEADLTVALEALGRSPEPGQPARLAVDVERRKAAAVECTRLRTQLERRPQLQAELETERSRYTEAVDLRQTLLDKVKALDFDRDVLAAAEAARLSTKQKADAATAEARGLQVAAATTAARVEGEATRLADGEAQHATLAETTEDARHLGRLSLLLGKFRDGVVGTVGPRLAAQAADLFAELTDHEYDRLDVDPDTYELQIIDAGITHGMGRFSGSETDLANLALRVAISEHVRFQAGGAVGLLVLDEVFG